MLFSKDFPSGDTASSSTLELPLVVVFLLMTLTTASEIPDNILGLLLLSSSVERRDLRFVNSFSNFLFLARRLCFSISNCSAELSLASRTDSAITKFTQFTHWIYSQGFAHFYILYDNICWLCIMIFKTFLEMVSFNFNIKTQRKYFFAVSS